MGKKHSNTTKSGRYINPTDQYRKHIRQKELKRNKQQRTTARNNVLNGKDPHQILNELEEVDCHEYDVSREETAHVVVWREKRKKLKENFDKILKFLEKEDPTQCENLKNLLQIYEIKRSQRELAYERAKMADEITIDDIPMPEDLPEDVEFLQPANPVDIRRQTVEQAEESEEEIDMANFEFKYGKPPPPPSGPPTVLSSDDEEEEKYQDYWQNFPTGGNTSHYQQYSNMIPQSFHPHYDEPYYVPQQPYYAPSHDQPYEYVCPAITHTQTSNYPPPSQDYHPDATIEAKPQLRNLREAATCFLPTSLRVQRQYKDAKGRLVNTYRPKITPTDPLEMNIVTDKTESKDEAYERFMKEIKGFL